MNDNIETLRDALAHTSQEWRLFDRRVEEEARAAAAAVRAKYKGELDELAAVRNAAHKALVEAQERTTHPWQGKRVFRTERVYSYFGRKHTEVRIEGIVEIFTRTTELSAGTRYYRYHPGDPIVRLLKKDGKPGKKTEHLGVNWKLVEEETAA